ncbi:DUF4394 domain-containing protein [Taibaiella chishuiensis]|uniref:Putative secreted protein (Por secretion system target) n=1 Tax=Taibaiella chishuiensis TaxID=1434707 RepID=A0A2P8CSN1_9BACT|nr:DUF4394 domain-containing protein [Taibaiella chishuiensis]PSK87985.1 putative secreted protein (Por secretion system target) [Taibaiella chishuiensis]
MKKLHTPFKIRTEQLLRSLLAGSLLLAAAAPLSAQQIFALSNGNLVSFSAAVPLLTSAALPITGITPGQVISGMDFRPATGQLYILGYNSINGQARLYTVNTGTAVATPIGAAAVTLATGMSKLSFDFNPTVDRIRVTSANGNNYRLHPVTGAIAATDGNLAYLAGDIHAGTTPSVSAGAYTNSYIAATSTTLYNFDDNLNILTRQDPPNAGSLNTVGPSGLQITTGSRTDLDIYFDPVTSTNTAFFTANPTLSLTDNLYTINLATGAASLVGAIGLPGITPIDDIAIAIDRTVPPAIAGRIVYGLTSNAYLISFDSDAPGTIRSHAAITGITAGQALAGLDVRPLTGQLYAMGYNATTGESQLYTINPATAAATVINTTPVSLATGLTQISFDFNPTVDRIRVTAANGNNYRLHPLTGAIAATDLALAYAAGDIHAGATPAIAAGAYTNSYIGTTATQLYNYDITQNSITLQDPPNNGTLNTKGASGISVNPADPSVDMDIYFNSSTGTNQALLAANTGSSAFDFLYNVNLSTGAATAIGRIGFGTALTDIAVQIDNSLPAIIGQLTYAVTATQNIITFDNSNPGVIRSQAAITGIATGQVIAGMDMRPATGELYLMGYDNVTGNSQLYTLNAVTGIATAVAPAITLAAGMGNIGFDFNPTVDRIRVIGSNNASYRLIPTTGLLAATDVNLAYAAGDPNAGTTPNVSTCAYTNSFNGATTTTLYDYDHSLNIFAIQNPPNNGTLNTLGASGIIQNLADPTTDLDIYYSPTLLSNTAYFVANTATNDRLYSVNLASGAATDLGLIGNGIAIRDIAVHIEGAPLPLTLTSFRVNSAPCSAQLSWTTTDEKNVAHFQVERKGEQGGFEAIGTVAASNTTGQQAYTYTDKDLQEGKFLYRLKIQDADGGYHYSNTEARQISCGNSKINLYPNPARDYIRISLAGVSGTACSIRIVDVTGRTAYLKSATGAQTLTIPISQLVSGLYTVMVSDGNHMEILRFEKID